ncbi:MAG: hypothetical protein LBD09_05325 [Treponema sp.]|jgi:hypothetical protein|nr:hypothetical protein [Treponema sp.]
MTLMKTNEEDHSVVTADNTDEEDGTDKRHLRHPRQSALLAVKKRGSSND